MRWWLVFIALLVVASASAAPVQDLQRGYNPRACGFDMDDDGVRGEPEDCHVADGVTLDPDDDGINEDIIYVDCNTGSDVLGCGSPGDPCNTIEYAWDAIADGPSDGAEDIVAFRGVCTPELYDFPQEFSGVSGVRIAQPTGSQVREFEYPSNPAMLVGWDSDNDGEYPPYDPDDVAVLNGAGLERAFRTNTGPTRNHRVEFAHFKVIDYGRTNTARPFEGGFIKQFDSATPQVSHVYYHDLELENINRGRAKSSGRNIFTEWQGARQSFFAYENIICRFCASYFFRGTAGADSDAQWTAAGGIPSGPIRMQNFEGLVEMCDRNGSRGQECPGPFPAGKDMSDMSWESFTKIWGTLDGWELLDSRFDCNVGPGQTEWLPEGGCQFVGINTCLNDVDVVNSEFIDGNSLTSIEGGSSACPLRPTTDIVFDRNYFHNSYDYDSLTTDALNLGVRIAGCTGGSSGVKDVWFTNNIFEARPGAGLRSFVDVDCPNSDDGHVRIVGNTFKGDITYTSFQGYIHLRGGTPSPLNTYTITNNIFDGLDGLGDFFINSQYAPSAISSDYNVFSGSGGSRWKWQNGPLNTLADWQDATGQDMNSVECAPEYAPDNIHLIMYDTCAQDAGTDISPITPVDFDGDSRPQGLGWDVGADEVAGGPSCHWADSDCSGVVSIPELVAVILAWQSGSRTIPELVDAIVAWQS